MHRRAFSLPELAASTTVIALALAITSIGADHSRRLARCGEDLSHFRQIFGATASYAADFSDRMWHFSWSEGATGSSYPDLATASDQYQAASFQMVDIIRRRTGRTTFPPLPGNPLMSIVCSHVVLQDYLGAAMPGRMFVAAGDPRLSWANDPLGYDAGLYVPNFGTSVTPNQVWRHPYGGSFRPSYSFIDVSPLGSRIFPYFTTELVYYLPGTNGTRFGGRSFSEVSYPSRKVLLQDQISRYFGRPQWYSDPTSRMPVLMSDGAAAVRAWSEANPGANPNSPAAGTPTQQYAPSVIDPPAASPPQVYPVSTLWTRMMLQGRDFGGPPVYP
jgi:hypothetical protein